MNGFTILIDEYLLARGTLDISQYSEVIPDTSKACQNLEKSIIIIIIIYFYYFVHTCDCQRHMFIFI